jgi:integrase
MPHPPKAPSEQGSRSWVETFRRLVRASYGPGWILREHRGGRTQINQAWPDGSRSSVTVPLPWRAESCPALLVLVERLDALLKQQAMSLSAAMKLINLEDAVGSPTQRGKATTNWHRAVERFRVHMVEESGRVHPRTWHRAYRVHLQQALELLERPKAPRNGRGLLQALVLAHPTPAGCAGRRERLGNVTRFLNFAVDQCGMAEQYRPPLDHRDLIGKRQQRKPPATPLLDHQFLSLYQAVQDPRWRLAIGLLGVFGLRPAELECCRVEQMALRVDGVKRNSAGCSAARLVHGLDPAGGNGLADALLDELRSKGESALPRAVVAAFWSTRVRQHLVRYVPHWFELLDQARATGQGHLTVYGMRHGFAFRGSQLYGLIPRVLAALMGHTTAVHLGLPEKVRARSSCQRAKLEWARDWPFMRG